MFQFTTSLYPSISRHILSHHPLRRFLSTPPAPPPRRVLSLQSHVVHGYVGNKAVTFPLQLLGFDVDPLNTTQLCNHTGYALHPGHRMDERELRAIVDGLAANGLLSSYSHLLSGFVGSPAVLRALADAVPLVRRHSPGLLYFCDPVLGDNGALYVPEESVEIYRELVIPHADLLKPNAFECRLLTGISPSSLDAAMQICGVFHRVHGIPAVLISSLEQGAADADELTAFLSWNHGASQYFLDVPRVSSYFTGTGDLLTSQILAWSAIHPDDAALAFEKSIATVHHVIETTFERHGATSSEQYPPAELELIACRDFILDPIVQFPATLLES